MPAPLSENPWLLGLVIVVLLVFVLGFVFAKVRQGKRREAEEQIPAPTPSSTQVPPVPSIRSARPTLSKAIASWIPLLRGNSKERNAWEAALIQSDMSFELTEDLLSGLDRTSEPPLAYFKRRLGEIIGPAERTDSPWIAKKPWVVFLVGPNGVGKTTTIVKLAFHFKRQGLRVGVVGADTFRKAAIDQLEKGCQKVDAEFFSLAGSEATEGADPAAVVFDGLKKFSGLDVIFVDTSGRLHSKKNLMEELKKMKRVAAKSLEGAPHEIWMIVDATLGQNAVAQGKSFNEAVGLTGLVLTKMDGLSRGGTVFQLFRELSAPIRYVGFGEKETDLEPFVSNNFIEELFDQEETSS